MEKPDFLQRLKDAPLLCDGAMGTQLFVRGVHFDQCFDELNLSRPALVQQIHRTYLEAGADLIETNTFGANRFKLHAHGLEYKVRDINATAARLARDAVADSGRAAFVLGAIGPLGFRLAPLGSLSRYEAASALREQIAALAEAGVDALLFETIADLSEIRLGIATAREITALPIIAQMTFGEDGMSIVGNSPEDFVHAMETLEVDVIGVNCSVGPARLLPVAERIVSLGGGVKVSAQPNAGWPEMIGDRLIYPSTPEYFGDFARHAVEGGVAIVGGCCGTTPAHTRAMRHALDGTSAPSDGPRLRVPETETIEVRTAQTAPGTGPTELQKKLSGGRFIVSVEIDPPKSADATKLLAAARMLKSGGVDVLNVADTPMARMRMSAWALCHLFQTDVGLETVLHFPTRGRNLLRVQGDLLAAHALGIRNLLVVMGDPTSHGDYPQATDQTDIVPSGLVRLIKHQFNAGMDHASSSIGPATTFHVGVALNLSAADLGKEIRTFHKKIEAGADYALTQPVYEGGVCARFMRRYEDQFGPVPIPVLMGLMPLASARNAEFIHNEVPGLQLPLSALERMRGAGKAGRREGIKICQELLLEAHPMIQGVYVMPTLERFESVMEIMDALPQWRPALSPVPAN